MLHNISIHTSAREVTLHLSQFHSCYLFQSTLLQGKWRIKALKSLSDVISIHTSAREVTGDARWRMQRHGYFNPHFRKGSDGWKSFYKTTTSEFQSTLPQGKWPFQPWRVVTIRYISIHTSAREVTTAGWSAGDSRGFQSTLPQGKWPTVVSETVRQTGFQSTLPQGKWPDSRHSRPWTISFQSTLPQGKWLHWPKETCRTPNFNPHFRKGSDDALYKMAAQLVNFNPHFRKGSDGDIVSNWWGAWQFQSTLPQGKWLVDHALTKHCLNISIHTSAREVTPCSSSICVRYWDFNPHFRKGSDEMSVLITYLSYISIHTSAREVTDTAFIPINLLPNFNPHFRKGSD